MALLDATEDANDFADTTMAEVALCEGPTPNATTRYTVLADPAQNSLETRELVDSLRQKEVQDLHVIAQGVNRGQVSLGVYRKLGNAEKRQAKVSSHGFVVHLDPQTRRQIIADGCACQACTSRPLKSGKMKLCSTGTVTESTLILPMLPRLRMNVRRRSVSTGSIQKTPLSQVHDPAYVRFMIFGDRSPITFVKIGRALLEAVSHVLSRTLGSTGEASQG